MEFLIAGDSGIVVEFGKIISEEINAKVKAAYELAKSGALKGITGLTPTYRSLLVSYNPIETSFDEIKAAFEKGLSVFSEAGGKNAASKLIHIPVCYGSEFGEDMPNVIAHTGLTEKEIIEIHSGREYLIYMLGFLPGFPYLGGMDKRLITPRLKNPRTKIPAGSVGIGGEQTGIYPLASPGGWQLIGRTPLKVYDPNRAEPFMYASGDRIKFEPITRTEYDKLVTVN
ncbi:MAG: 5-oxoprolinase subunit PxpB [Christensenellaceae bacterium]|jgi:KipI family sensor histidine kinase inhibitor|nr:5-oxoprolinase subunit PxpB [Christensenellaceae bacterium]